MNTYLVFVVFILLFQGSTSLIEAGNKKKQINFSLICWHKNKYQSIMMECKNLKNILITNSI